MNPYLGFALRTLGAFIGGIVANTAGHVVVLKTDTDWFMLMLSGAAAAGAYWTGVVSPNPWKPDNGPKP